MPSTNDNGTDQESLNRIRRGGRERTEGVSRLYQAYARRFLAYFLKHRMPREHAEELVQDVFVNVVRHCGDFRGDTRIDAWMWAIVRNGLIDYVRRQRPEQSVDELADCVRGAFAAFGETFRDRAAVLSLVAFDGWTIDDVAAMLKRTPGATREYLSQCRKKLKAFLEPCREFLAG
jgi:RNA polymerase sigma-70 factor (ECF subfamily)